MSTGVINDLVNLIDTSDLFSEFRQSSAQSNHETVETRFNRLCADWKEQAEFLSQSGKMAMLPSYQQIIGLGPAALPFIVRELKREPDHWFWALQAITGEDPVLPHHRDKIPAMTKDWIEWADARGIQ